MDQATSSSLTWAAVDVDRNQTGYVGSILPAHFHQSETCSSEESQEDFQYVMVSREVVVAPEQT